MRAEQSALSEERLRKLFPTATEDAITLYHGSPHVFDTPDWEANLRKGEGNMSYGPGGYTTGSRPLAGVYANKLSKAREVPPKPASGPLGYFHTTLQQALRSDPDATIAWLQGKTFQKALETGDANPNRIMPAGGANRSADGPYIRVSKPNDVNVEAYKDWIDSKGVKPEDLRLRPINQKNMKEVLGLGERLAGGPSPVLGSVPAEWRERIGKGWGSRFETQPGETFFVPDNTIINNLRATAASQAGVAGPKFKASMQPNGAVPLDQDTLRQLQAWDGTLTPGRKAFLSPGREPNIYEMELKANPNALLYQDYPIGLQEPIHGALSRLYGSLGLPLPKPEALGSEVFKQIPNDINGMRALKEAGIPASAFLRAGRRDQSVPNVFKPEDYNFVIHNQDMLDILNRKPYATGGRVP